MSRVDKTALLKFLDGHRRAHERISRERSRRLSQLTPEESLLEYAKAGADGFIITGAEPFDHETIERVARDVKPRLDRLIAEG